MLVLMMSKRIFLTKGENVNHAYLDDVEKKSLDGHHQKGGECECINTWFWWCQRRIKQGCYICFKINTRSLQQTKSWFKISSRPSLAS